MRYLLTIIISSFLFSSYYGIGDTVTTDHQDIEFDVCYGNYAQDHLKLSHFNGKISVFGLSATWWPPACTFSLEALIDSIGNDSRIKIFESLDDIGQPYTCTQWGDLGQEDLPLIVESDNVLFNLFSNGYYAETVVLDPNMVFRHIGSDLNDILNIVEQILSESHWVLGDIDFNQIVDILDIVLLVNFILDPSYSFSADVNNDQIVNIQDIIILINIILN